MTMAARCKVFPNLTFFYGNIFTSYVCKYVSQTQIVSRMYTVVCRMEVSDSLINILKSSRCLTILSLTLEKVASYPLCNKV